MTAKQTFRLKKTTGDTKPHFCYSGPYNSKPLASIYYIK